MRRHTHMISPELSGMCCRVGTIGVSPKNLNGLEVEKGFAKKHSRLSSIYRLAVTYGQQVTAHGIVLFLLAMLSGMLYNNDGSSYKAALLWSYLLWAIGLIWRGAPKANEQGRGIENDRSLSCPCMEKTISSQRCVQASIIFLGCLPVVVVLLQYYY